MAITVIRSPDLCTGIKNLIYFTLDSNASATKVEIRVKLLIEKVFNSAIFTEEVVLQQTVDGNGIADFYLQTLIESFLNPQIPNINATSPVQASGIVVKYKISYAEVLDTVLGSFTDSGELYALNGGFSFVGSRQNNSISLLGSGNVFLSTKSVTKFIYREQKEYLYVLPKSSSSNSELTITITYTDNTTGSKSIALGNLLAYQPVYLDVGFGAQDYEAIDNSKTISSIIVSDNNGESFTYILRTHNTPWLRQFFYQNSLGAYDSMICTGQAKEDSVIRSVNAVIVQDKNSSINSGLYVTTSNSIEEDISVSSGYFKTKKEAIASRDAMLSQQTFEYTNMQGTVDMANYPVSIISASKAIQDDDFMWFFQFRYKYNYIITAQDRVL